MGGPSFEELLGLKLFLWKDLRGHHMGWSFERVMAVYVVSIVVCQSCLTHAPWITSSHSVYVTVATPRA